MSALLYSVDFEPWAAPLSIAARRARDMGPALRDIGELGVAFVRRNFDDGGGPNRWPDLAPSTLLNRARHPNGPSGGAARKVFRARAQMGPAHAREAAVLERGGRGRALRKAARAIIENAKPLIWTKALYRDIRAVVGGDFVDVGSTMVKSWTLFFGSRLGKKPVVPARNPFGMTPGDEASILGIIARHVLGVFERGQA